LQQSLGNYRLLKARQESVEDGYIYEFQQGSDPTRRVWVVWKPQGPAGTVSLDVGDLKAQKAERTPLLAGAAPAVTFQQTGSKLEVEASEAPVFIWLQP
jgi:hypothetical protein